MEQRGELVPLGQLPGLQGRPVRFYRIAAAP
jgi:hypothetical protein